MIGSVNEYHSNLLAPSGSLTAFRPLSSDPHVSSWLAVARAGSGRAGLRRVSGLSSSTGWRAELALGDIQGRNGHFFPIREFRLCASGAAC